MAEYIELIIVPPSADGSVCGLGVHSKFNSSSSLRWLTLCVRLSQVSLTHVCSFLVSQECMDCLSIAFPVLESPDKFLAGLLLAPNGTTTSCYQSYRFSPFLLYYLCYFNNTTDWIFALCPKTSVPPATRLLILSATPTLVVKPTGIANWVGLGNQSSSGKKPQISAVLIGSLSSFSWVNVF